ncbi:MAG: O-methyltransferase, partial [Pseudomonadota bacterium]
FERVVDRQNFNKPFEDVICQKSRSKDFVSGFSGFRASYPEDANFVVWLDYVNPKERLIQLEEFSTLVSFGKPFDVFRITVNANATTLKSSDAKKPPQFKTVKHWRLSIFESQLAKFPTSATAEEMTTELFPNALARTIGVAAQEGAKRKKFVVRPLTVTTYSDGNHPMLSVTAIVLPTEEADNLMDASWIADWKHKASNWEAVTHIDVPDLSMKEKMLIDRHISVMNDTQIANKLGFELGDDKPSTLRKLSQYREHFRFYPQFARMA